MDGPHPDACRNILAEARTAIAAMSMYFCAGLKLWSMTSEIS